MPIQVLAVERNPVLLKGIAALIQSQPGMQLAGAADCAEECLNLYAKTCPDVTLIDLNLAGSASIRAIRHIRQLDPEACVIGLTSYELDPVNPKAQTAGVSAILAKDQIASRLLDLIYACLGKNS